MRVLDLFSGIGGFSLGFEQAGMETIAFCECDPHARQILKKHWPDVPIFDDVRSLNGEQFRGSIELVCGGFPCQDLSTTGKQGGIEGTRSGLYREMLRIIGDGRPRFAVFENVTGLLTGDHGRWFAKFLYDLAAFGFDAEWFCIPASFFGAPHHRDRVWVVAYAESERCEGFAKISDVLSKQIQSIRSSENIRNRFNLSEPAIRGANDGLPRQLDRLRRLGNSVVPVIPLAIGRAIMEIAGKPLPDLN